MFVIASFTLAHAARNDNSASDSRQPAISTPAMLVTEISSLEAGVRHYFNDANGEIDFIFYIAEDAEYADDFINHIVTTLTELGIETMADISQAREAIIESSTVRRYQDDDLQDTGARSFPPQSFLVNRLYVHFWDRNINFHPPAFWYDTLELIGHGTRYLYSGHLALQGFSALRSSNNPNLWNFTANYSGTLWLRTSIPVLPPQGRLVEDTSEEDVEIVTQESDAKEQQYYYEYRMQRLIDMRDAHYAAMAMYNDEGLDNLRYTTIRLVACNEVMSQSSIFIPEVNVSTWNQIESFRPPQHLFYTRQVGGRLYQGFLTLHNFAMTPMSNGLWDVLAVYSGWIFWGTGGVLPDPWELCVCEECEYKYNY